MRLLSLTAAALFLFTALAHAQKTRTCYSTRVGNSVVTQCY